MGPDGAQVGAVGERLDPLGLPSRLVPLHCFVVRPMRAMAPVIIEHGQKQYVMPSCRGDKLVEPGEVRSAAAAIRLERPEADDLDSVPVKRGENLVGPVGVFSEAEAIHADKAERLSVSKQGRAVAGNE